MKIAILIDGSYFIKRYKHVYSKELDAKTVVKKMMEMSCKHASSSTRDLTSIYRIFFYDCLPFDKRVYNPISEKCIDYKKTDVYTFRNQIHHELKKQRKVALRRGHLSNKGIWSIHEGKVKELLKKEIQISDLKENDIFYKINQKGVDMRIGLDIASMAFKKQVQQIILISGDSDFIPAAKLARREGIDFILDPMWNHVQPDLIEHVDGLRSTCPKPESLKSQYQ